MPKSPFPFLQFYTAIPILNIRTRLRPPFHLTTAKRHRFGSPTPLLSSPNRNYSADFRQLLPQKHSGHLGAVQTRGGWWSLRGVEASESSSAKPVTVWIALKRIWSLIGDDNWIVFLALGAMSIASVSEISMPRILTASVFSASRGESAAFSRSTRMLILLLIISGICSGLRSGCFAIANTILVKRLRQSLYAALVFQDTSFFDTETVGNLTSRLGSDCQRLSHVIRNDIHLIVRNVIQGTGALINLLTLSWPLTLPTLIICSVLAVIFSIYGRYKWWLDKLAFVSIRESAAYGLWSMSFLTLYRSTQVLAVLLGGIYIMNSRASPEQLRVKLQTLMGNIQFVNVSSLSFKDYRMPLVPILDHFSLSIQTNEVVAIVGLSGSGKSTLVNLMLRLYQPVTGQIYMDGIPLEELDTRWLRENIGFVGQDPDLFNMDIESNIRYGCPRDVKEEDIEWAAKQAYVHEFISSLPRGYQTMVDNDLLSGGQKQRIAIARAILRDPAILILDEATSALYAENEHYLKEVLHALRNESRSKRTVILIAHRLSTVKTADRIVVMDCGRIVEA
ncbi:EMB3012 protein [Hibiscus syriacus]|uniref:EMB3012 protein n=1 Tax=Hibiscus syriacus TaxID=106335 RepID=A0A6A3A0K9_HIBSY|nr:EMB3012 protein [Hibiscus syriacus]